MKENDFAFQNQGEMHEMHEFKSKADYYCGLVPHNMLPWSVTFRTYASYKVIFFSFFSICFLFDEKKLILCFYKLNELKKMEPVDEESRAQINAEIAQMVCF